MAPAGCFRERTPFSFGSYPSRHYFTCGFHIRVSEFPGPWAAALSGQCASKPPSGAAQQQKTSARQEKDGKFHASESVTVSADPGGCKMSDPMCQIQYQLIQAQLQKKGTSNTAHTAVAGSVAIPISPGVVADIPFAWVPSTKKVCLGIGGGTGSPGLNVGGVYSSTNIENVLSGASVSVAAQSGAVGGQTIHNNSGIAVGNSMGSPGASVTVTYSWCF